MDTQTPEQGPLGTPFRELVTEADARQRLVDFLGGAGEFVLLDAA